MLRNPFTKWLWDGHRALLGWAVAVAAVGSMYAAFWPSMQTPDMAKAMEALPKDLMEALNYDDLASAAGYLSSAVYGLLVPLLVAVFTIAAGTRAIAGDEEAGTMDLVLAHPVNRASLGLQRFAGILVGILVVAGVLLLAMLGLRGPAELGTVGVADFAAMTVHLVLFGALFAAVSYAIGAATGRRALTLGLSAGVAVITYLVNAIFPQVPGAEWVRNLSPWHWYLGGDPLKNGIQYADTGLTLGVTIILVALGTWAFTRRDVAV